MAMYCVVRGIDVTVITPPAFWILHGSLSFWARKLWHGNKKAALSSFFFFFSSVSSHARLFFSSFPSLAGVFSVNITTSIMAAKKPNILYIMADQMAAPLLSMHDPSSRIKTPNLDRLSSEGVTFDSAYCNSPLCAPSRFVMVTGQLPSKIGAFDNAADLPADIPTYAHYLRREGYHTALAGKMHFCGPDQLHGYEQRLTSDIYPGDYGWSVNWDEPVSVFERECDCGC
jgi:hypothetical protein